MKGAVLLIFLVIFLATVEAKTLTENLKVGNSVIIEDQRISLLNLDKKDDKVVLCINDVKTIVSKARDRTVNNVRVEVKSVTLDQARLKLESVCKNCILSDNDICINQCNTNSDCDDTNDSTIDKCTRIPKECVYTDIPEAPKQELKEEPKEINISLTVEEPKKEEKPVGMLAVIINFISKFFN